MAIIIAAEVTKSEHIRVRMFLWFSVGFSSFLAAKRNAITLVSIALAIVPLSVCWCICASVCVCVCVCSSYVVQFYIEVTATDSNL